MNPVGWLIGRRVKHLGTQAVRMVSGARVGRNGGVILHFSQVIKKQDPNGKPGARTFYWTELSKCLLLDEDE